MPDLATELAHLEEADRHIAEARERIEKSSERVDAADAQGTDSALSSQSLETLKETLAAMEGHRAVIVRTIADIREGRY